MKDEPPASEEFVIKEYPNSTHWVEGQKIAGTGNLILTNERLIFLHRIAPTDKQAENLGKLSGAPTRTLLEFALALHKRNFQIPLSSIISVKTGTFSMLPLPRFCLRVAYLSGKKKTKSLTFMFTISLLRGIFQWEITTVQAWVMIIRRARRAKLLKIS